MDKSTEAIFWLKEFSKSWVNIVSDEVVYHEQVWEQESSRVIGLTRGRAYIKDYLTSNLWLEILFKIRRDETLDLYVALIEAIESIHPEKLRVSQSGSNINFGQTRQDNTMLINVINFAENPERMPPLIPIRSVIRLYRLDISPDVLTEIFEPAGEVRTLLNVDWEDGASISFDGKSPSEIIKSRTQSMSDLTYQKSPSFRIFPSEIRAEDIASILRVFINGTSVRLTCDEGFNFSVEDIKVFLRPIDSSEGISHRLHV